MEDTKKLAVLVEDNCVGKSKPEHILHNCRCKGCGVGVGNKLEDPKQAHTATGNQVC